MNKTLTSSGIAPMLPIVVPLRPRSKVTNLKEQRTHARCLVLVVATALPAVAPRVGIEPSKNGRFSAVVAGSDFSAAYLATPGVPESQSAPKTEWMETWTTT
jgi:hypothetical protein